MSFMYLTCTFITAVLLLFTSVTSAQEINKSHNQWKATVKETLEESAENFVNVLAPVEQVDWQFRPNGYRHSIGEVAEHAALSHQSLQNLVMKAMASPSRAEFADGLLNKYDLIRRHMLDTPLRTENFSGKNILRTKAEVIEYFQMAHKKAMNILNETSSRSLSTHIYRHPRPLYGHLTALQWMYYLGSHTQRHVKQIWRMIQRVQSSE